MDDKEDVTLRPRSGCGSFWDRGLPVTLFGNNRTLLITISIAAYMSSSVALLLSNSALVRQVALPSTVTFIQMVFTLVALCVFVPCTLRGSWRAMGRWTLVVPLLFSTSLVTSNLASAHARLGTTMMVRYIGPLISLGIEATLGERIRKSGRPARY